MMPRLFVHLGPSKNVSENPRGGHHGEDIQTAQFAPSVHANKIKTNERVVKLHKEPTGVQPSLAVALDNVVVVAATKPRTLVDNRKARMQCSVE